jgi:2'-5' RNA ligase
MAKSMDTNRAGSFPQQTHFIGVLVPKELSDALTDCRVWMHEQYGCKSGYGTPIHITLVPPFHLDEMFTTQQVVASTKEAIYNNGTMNHLFSFNAQVKGFASFGDRTLFAQVLPSPQWTPLRDAVLNELLATCPGCTKKDRRPFTPHLTIANRDIPVHAAEAALAHFAEFDLEASFPVNTICVFTRINSSWISDDQNIIHF